MTWKNIIVLWLFLYSSRTSSCQPLSKYLSTRSMLLYLRCFCSLFLRHFILLNIKLLTISALMTVEKNVKIILNHSNIFHCACISKGNYISLIWPLIHLKVVIDERNDSLTQIMNDLSFVPDIKFLKSFNVFKFQNISFQHCQTYSKVCL